MANEAGSPLGQKGSKKGPSTAAQPISDPRAVSRLKDPRSLDPKEQAPNDDTFDAKRPGSRYKRLPAVAATGEQDVSPSFKRPLGPRARRSSISRSTAVDLGALGKHSPPSLVDTADVVLRRRCEKTLSAHLTRHSQEVEAAFDCSVFLGCPGTSRIAVAPVSPETLHLLMQRPEELSMGGLLTYKLGCFQHKRTCLTCSAECLQKHFTKGGEDISLVFVGENGLEPATAAAPAVGVRRVELDKMLFSTHTEAKDLEQLSMDDLPLTELFSIADDASTIVAQPQPGSKHFRDVLLPRCSRMQDFNTEAWTVTTELDRTTTLFPAAEDGSCLVVGDGRSPEIAEVDKHSHADAKLLATTNYSQAELVDISSATPTKAVSIRLPPTRITSIPSILDITNYQQKVTNVPPANMLSTTPQESAPMLRVESSEPTPVPVHGGMSMTASDLQYLPEHASQPEGDFEGPDILNEDVCRDLSPAILHSMIPSLHLILKHGTFSTNELRAGLGYAYELLQLRLAESAVLQGKLAGGQVSASDVRAAFKIVPLEELDELFDVPALVAKNTILYLVTRKAEAEALIRRMEAELYEERERRDRELEELKGLNGRKESMLEYWRIKEDAMIANLELAMTVMLVAIVFFVLVVVKAR